MKLLRRMGLVSFLVLTIALMSGTARAQTAEVIIYDGFEDGLDGGFGWAGGWYLADGTRKAQISDTRPYLSPLSLEMFSDNAQRPLRIPSPPEGSDVVLRFWFNHDIPTAESYNPIFVVIVTSADGYDYLVQIFITNHPAGEWKQYEVSLTPYADGNWRLIGFYPFVGTGTRYLDEIEVVVEDRGELPTPIPSYTPVSSPTSLPVPSPTMDPSSTLTPTPISDPSERIEICGQIEGPAFFVGDLARPVVLICDVTVLNPYVLHTGHGQEIYLCGFDLRIEGYALITHGAVHPGCP